MGWAYHDMGEYKSALKIFEKAEAFHRSKGSANEIRIAVWCVARTLRFRLIESKKPYPNNWLWQRNSNPQGETDGYVFEEIGECLLELNREDKVSHTLQRRMKF